MIYLQTLRDWAKKTQTTEEIYKEILSETVTNDSLARRVRVLYPRNVKKITGMGQKLSKSEEKNYFIFSLKP